MTDTEVTTLPAPFNEVRIPDGLFWKYEAMIRAGHVEHLWLLKGELGAIHISARLTEWQGRHDWIGGIECHNASPPEYMNPDTPSHEHCWILDAPCWHDGTSLGFSERVAPMLPPPYEPWKAHDMKPWHHAYVTGVLVDWYCSQFQTEPDAP